MRRITDDSRVAAPLVAAVLTSCGGGDGGQAAYTVGGTVTGLAGSGLVLEYATGGQSVSVSADGTFVFPKSVQAGSIYSVTVEAQPQSPTQNCGVTNGSGTVGNANVTSVTVSCTTTYSVGGTVSGLIGSGLVLQNNGTGNLTGSNGTYAFSPLASGAAYSITVSSQPTSPDQTCVPTDGVGVIGSANVTNVNIICTLSPGRFAYLAGDGQSFSVPPGTIDTFLIDAVTGALTETGSQEVGSPIPQVSPTISISPNGRFAYVVDHSSGTISVDTIDGANGVLSASSLPVVTIPGLGISDISPIALNSVGTFGYVIAQDGIYVLAIDVTTGIVSLSAAAPVVAGSATTVVVDPLNRFAYAVDSNAGNIYEYTINPTTGVLTPMAGSPVAGGTGAVTLNPSGTYAYIADSLAKTIAVYAINSSSGALTPIAGSPFGAGADVRVVKIAPAGDFAYSLNYSAQTVDVFAISPISGSLTALGSGFEVGTGVDPSSLIIHPSGKFVYVTALGFGALSSTAIVSEYSVDGTTGQLSPISGSPISVADELSPINLAIAQ